MSKIEADAKRNGIGTRDLNFRRARMAAMVKHQRPEAGDRCVWHDS